MYHQVARFINDNNVFIFIDDIQRDILRFKTRFFFNLSVDGNLLSENTLRIIYTGPPLAADRESLFWMNVKTIPSVDKNALNGRNVLQLAILSRMKLFLRPIQLQELAEFDHHAFRVGFNANLRDPNMRYHLALLDGEVVGMIGLHLQFHLHHVNWIGEIP